MHKSTFSPSHLALMLSKSSYMLAKQRKEAQLIIGLCIFKVLLLFLFLLISKSRKIIHKFNTPLISFCICQTVFASSWKLLPPQEEESSCCLYISVLLTLSLPLGNNCLGAPLPDRAKTCFNDVKG